VEIGVIGNAPEEKSPKKIRNLVFIGVSGILGFWGANQIEMMH